MTKFLIENSVSAAVLGIYEADTEAQALDLFAVEAGYKSHADAQAQVPSKDGEILVTALPAFADDGEAKAAIQELVVTLIGVAEDAGQTPEDWNDISCEGSLSSTLKEMGGQYVAAANGDDDELRDEIVEFADTITIRLTSGKPDELARAVTDASSLTELRDALVAADAHAKVRNLNIEAIYNATELPTFGGAAIDKPGVFSWDETHVLTGFGEWDLIGRADEGNELLAHQESTVTMGDTEYRFNDRHYYGRELVDTIRFARWTDAEDGRIQVFSGYIDIPAFPRDTVLMSELVAAIERRESELQDDEAA